MPWKQECSRYSEGVAGPQVWGRHVKGAGRGRLHRNTDDLLQLLPFGQVLWAFRSHRRAVTLGGEESWAGGLEARVPIRPLLQMVQSDGA